MALEQLDIHMEIKSKHFITSHYIQNLTSNGSKTKQKINFLEENIGKKLLMVLRP